MSERFDHSIDLSTPPTAVRWDLGESRVAQRPGEKVCAVRLGERTFALEARFIRGLRHVEEVTEVPRTPPHVLGVTYVQGSVQPLVDLGPALGEPAGVRATGPWVALWVVADSLSVLLAVDEVVAFEPATLEAAGETPDPPGDYTRGSAPVFGEPLPLLDLPRLLRDLKVAA